MTSAAKTEAAEMEARGVLERVELRYCQRCGALGIDRTADPEDANARGCAACRQALRWLLPEVRR